VGFPVGPGHLYWLSKCCNLAVIFSLIPLLFGPTITIHLTQQSKDLWILMWTAPSWKLEYWKNWVNHHLGIVLFFKLIIFYFFKNQNNMVGDWASIFEEKIEMGLPLLARREPDVVRRSVDSGLPSSKN
jgi:hypothetical protein